MTPHENVFPRDYCDARRRFLELADAAGARVVSFRHPGLDASLRPIFTDVALMARHDQRTMLIVQSGTHGIEGLAGSAVQLELLRRRSLPKNVAVALIHAINPWGFAHMRRVDEHNVDLNRNFVDHSRREYPENPAYDLLADAISPRSMSIAATLRSAVKIGRFAAAHGMAGVRAAISSGQYKHPRGLFFGGREDSWANGTIKRILTEVLDLPERVIFIDVHTGLGTPGQCMVLSNDRGDSAAVQWARALWGDLVQSTKRDDADSSDLHGSLKVAVETLLRGRRSMAVTLEFGTVGNTRVFRAMQLENWLYHWGGHCRDSRANAIKRRMKDAFMVDTDAWKRAVLRRAHEVLHAAGSA